MVNIQRCYDDSFTFLFFCSPLNPFFSFPLFYYKEIMPSFDRYWDLPLYPLICTNDFLSLIKKKYFFLILGQNTNWTYVPYSNIQQISSFSSLSMISNHPYYFPFPPRCQTHPWKWGTNLKFNNLVASNIAEIFVCRKWLLLGLCV